MSDEILRQLQFIGFDWLDVMRAIDKQLQTQSARITKLEAALRNIEADCESDYPPSYGAIKYAARAALEGGKDGQG